MLCLFFCPISILRQNIDIIVFALSKIISIPSVSSSPDNREDCKQAAIWLTKCLAQLGASSKTVRALFFFVQYLVWVIQPTKWIRLN